MIWVVIFNNDIIEWTVGSMNNETKTNTFEEKFTTGIGSQPSNCSLGWCLGGHGSHFKPFKISPSLHFLHSQHLSSGDGLYSRPYFALQFSWQLLLPMESKNYSIWNTLKLPNYQFFINQLQTTHFILFIWTYCSSVKQQIVWN